MLRVTPIRWFFVLPSAVSDWPASGGIILAPCCARAGRWQAGLRSNRSGEVSNKTHQFGSMHVCTFSHQPATLGLVASPRTVRIPVQPTRYPDRRNPLSERGLGSMARRRLAGDAHERPTLSSQTAATLLADRFGLVRAGGQRLVAACDFGHFLVRLRAAHRADRPPPLA